MTPLLVKFMVTLPLSSAKINNLQPKSISSVAVAAAVPEAQVEVASVAMSAGGNRRGGRQLAEVTGHVDVTTLVETESAAQDSAVTAMVRDGGTQIKRSLGCTSSRAPKPTI